MKSIKAFFTKKETIPLESVESSLFIYNENYVSPGTSILNENYIPPGSEWLPTPRAVGESLSTIILRQETRILNSEGKPIGDIHTGSEENQQLTTGESTWDNINLIPAEPCLNSVTSNLHQTRPPPPKPPIFTHLPISPKLRVYPKLPKHLRNSH